jgi:hypothetical protein
MRRLLLAISFAAVCLTSFTQTTSKISIDGKSNERKHTFSNYDTETKLRYSITNDNDNLYFCFSAEDERTQMRILKTGIQISVDIKGKKKVKNSVAYKPEFEMPTRKGPDAKPSIETEKNHFRLSPLILTLKGFKSYNEGIYEAKTLKNIQFAMDWDSTNSLIIEYKVPFSELSYSPDVTKDISVGVFLLAFEMPSGMMPPGGGGMMPPPGMSPPPGMGGPSADAMKSFEELSQEKKFWTTYKVQLSK